MQNFRKNMKYLVNIDYDCNLTVDMDNQEKKEYSNNIMSSEINLFKQKNMCKSSLSYTSTQSNNIEHTKSKRHDTSNRLIDSVRSQKMKVYSRHLYLEVSLSGFLTVFIIFKMCICPNPVCMAFRLNEESNSIYPKVTLMPSSSTSHKHRSKTIDVFYQAGVRFSLK